MAAAHRLLLPLAALLLAAPARSQSGDPRSDTTAVHRLEALVVTAERAAASVELSTHTVSVLSGPELRRRPGRVLADALRQVPGLAFVDFEGTGGDPQLVTRGFYGGGEAEYVVLLLDGRPLNALENGRIAWDLIPLAAIERIEVVRGGGSAAWGDAAMGGVINIITRTGSARAARASLSGGEHGVLEGSLAVSGPWHDRPVSVFGTVARSAGFRDHARRSTGALGATARLLDTDRTSIGISTLHDWRRFDEPGPLAAPALAAARTSSSPFYRFDRVEDWLHRLSVDGRSTLGEAARFAGSLTADYRHADRVRTVPLAPGFGDTSNRLLSTGRLLGSATLELDDLGLPGDDALVLGVDASAGRIASETYDVLSGPPDAYAGAAGTRGPLAASGTARRSTVAAFFGYELRPSPALRLTLGARFDALRDTFDDDAPDSLARRTATHFAFSPRAGVNLRYLETGRHRGHVYMTAARSFKAPTPDQLFDQRTFPVPVPPFEIGFANDALNPQYGTNLEAGVYHRAEILPGTIAAELTLAAYRLDLRDELDFDLETFRYQNIGRSRHSGIEAGLDVSLPGSVRTWARYTLQAATARIGEHAGNQLKAIPRHFIVAGVEAGAATGPAASLLASSARGIHLDDANTVELPPWTRWDARASYGFRGVNLFVQLFNILDAEYSTTGFPDSADPGTVYYYPAAGRSLSIGLSRDWW